MTNNGVESAGKVHLRNAPSNMSRIKYSQMAAFSGSLKGYFFRPHPPVPLQRRGKLVYVFKYVPVKYEHFDPGISFDHPPVPPE